MTTLTADQLTTLVYLARHQSRRAAKRYLRDHDLPADAATLDANLALATPEIVSAADALARERRTLRDAALADSLRQRQRDARAADLRIAAAAMEGDWEWIARHVRSRSDGTCWPERQRDAIARWGGTADAEAVADELAVAAAAGDLDLDGPPDRIVRAIRAAVDAADDVVCERQALAALEAAAVADGRWAVCLFVRGSLAVAEARHFADEQAACDYLSVAHGDTATSAYYAQVMDTRSPGPRARSRS